MEKRKRVARTGTSFYANGLQVSRCFLAPDDHSILVSLPSEEDISCSIAIIPIVSFRSPVQKMHRRALKMVRQTAPQSGRPGYTGLLPRCEYERPYLDGLRAAGL
jgi:hypothetical protein